MNTKSSIQAELDFFLNFETPIYPLSSLKDNQIYVKREDVIPFSFGGNKVRIASAYIKEAVQQGADTIVTYGASSSNLCRVIANFCYRYGMKCVIISPNENYVTTPNSEMVRCLGAEIIKCNLDEVSKTIDKKLEELKSFCKPYFIYGGGHGLIGANSYRSVMSQILDYEKQNQIQFDAIYMTCATGTSMTGLVLEKLDRKIDTPIVGISIARTKDRAEAAVESLLNANHSIQPEEKPYEIVEDFLYKGYGSYHASITETIRKVFCAEGLYLDTTYTGKAFYGMLQHLKNNEIKNQNILFVHTGGAPLFFKDNCGFLFESE